MIRLCTPSDAAQIAEIYRPFCEASHVSFETVAPSPEEMAARIQKISQSYPWIVEDRDGIITGYAYASRHRERAGYRWAVDVGVYVHEEYRGRGIAKALYGALFSVLRIQGYLKAYAGVSLPNPSSLALHRSLGFTPVGVYQCVGFKNGAWRDVCWWQYSLGPELSPPPEPRPLSELSGSHRISEALSPPESIRS
jgi:phosphinothricin acetyltransferase